eukprot:GHVU01155729.1.p3 GENE.GHVU01155729.1~~GHVU01155729.1.p3  ORF type:complete len:127 (+),score=15.24 GHVU01155729.1:1500-1880(+)
MLCKYSDVVICRVPHQGDLQAALEVASKPILNGGDGSGEHPSQALLDLFTICELFPRVLFGEPLVVTFYGDLKHGRTVHSLCPLLARFNCTFVYVAPGVCTRARTRTHTYTHTHSLRMRSTRVCRR